MKRLFLLIMALSLILSGCARSVPDDSDAAADTDFPAAPAGDNVDIGMAPEETETAGETPDIIYQYDYLEVGVSPEEESLSEDKDLRYIVTDDDDEPHQGTHVSWISCLIEGESIVLHGISDGVGEDPIDDGNYYLLELFPYEDSIEGHQMAASIPKSDDVRISIALRRDAALDRLYNKFILAVWVLDHYEAVSDYIFVTNPEEVSAVKTAYKEPLSKKGLLIEISEISDAFSLGVCNVIINIPFDTLLGEGIDYTYDGETYHFSREVVEAYDKTISMFSNKSMNVHVILLNRFDPDTPELFCPGVTGNEKGAMYYQFNAGTEEGYKYLRAIASFLARRYSGTDPDHGLVQNWIIGNEINNQSWNYIGAMDVLDYVREYARAFRVFYSAIKSEFGSARVYFSLDNNWNQASDGLLSYTARDTLYALSLELSSHGNIDWGLGYHPYPVPTVEPEFWDDFDTGLVTMSEDSPVVNFANLSVLTDYLSNDIFLDSEGNVRHIVLSEQGFTSESATRGTVEELQAASFAYAYYIADSNPYIDAFILSRQIDAPSELKSSLAFGLWTTSSKEDVNITPLNKKYIWNVFKNIDKQATTLSTTEFAKSLIGIDKWSDAIPNFKWRKLEK